VCALIEIGRRVSKIEVDAMPAHLKWTSIVSAAAFALVPLATAAAANDPTGVWYNDTGRGAVEIKPCGSALCGHVVWVKDTTDTKGCGRQIIGNAAKVGAATWDNGWIYSPENKKKYDVELKPLSNGTLQVTGYMGMKMFSKTMIWKRAPADLVRCGSEPIVAKADTAAKPELSKPKTAPKKPEAAKAKPAVKDTAVAAEPKIVPPAPKPAQRPVAKPAQTPTIDAPVDVARADPEPLASTPQVSTQAAGSPDAQPPAVPQVHALPGVEDGSEAPVVTAPPEDEDPAPRENLDMGKIAKKLAEIERDTGYGLKKTGSGNCRLKVPYATVNFPCKD
jgi:uncharacterized protein (DUF2147 family)